MAAASGFSMAITSPPTATTRTKAGTTSSAGGSQEAPEASPISSETP